MHPVSDDDSWRAMLRVTSSPPEMCFRVRKYDAAPKPMPGVDWHPDRRVVRVSFSASKRRFLHVMSVARQANVQSMAIDTNAVSAIAFAGPKSRQRVPRVNWERNETAHPTKNLSEPSLTGRPLFGVTRFCRQRVLEVPPAGTDLSGDRGTYRSAT